MPRHFFRSILIIGGFLFSSLISFAQAPVFTIQNKKDACDGLNNGSFEVLVSSATTGLTVQVFGPPNQGPFSATVGVPFLFSGLQGTLAGKNYLVVVADDNDNSFQSVTIFTIASISTSVTGSTNNSDCGTPNGAINITVTGGSGNFTYQWSGPAGFVNPGTQDLSGISGGSYSVNITDINTNCTRSLGPIVITDPSPLVFNVATTTSPVCTGTGGTVTLSSSEVGVTYEIYKNGTPTGITLPGTSGALSFTIPAGQLTPASAYGFTIRAVNGLCTPVFMSGTATITVNDSPTSAVLSGTATICTGGSTNLIVTITGGTSPYTIAINNGVGTINNYVSGTAIPVNPGATTTYNMVGNVTDALGCSVAGSGSAIVTVNTPPASAVLSGTATICSGTSTNLTVTITGGTSPYTITLDNGVGTINNYVSGTAIPVSPAATTTYNMVGNVTDAAGCSVAGTGSATVTVNPSPTSAVLSGTATICSGTSTNLTVTITGGTSPYTITINNGVGTINNYVSGTAIPVSPAATTAYSMVGNVTDALGCSVAGSGGATVTVNPSPTSAVLSGTATICAGGSTNLIVTITGGTSPYTIALDNGVGTINNYVSGTAIPVSPGATTTYNMVGNVTDALGCSVAGSGSATVTVGTPPASAVLSGTATICSGTSTNLSVTITGGTSPYTITINNGVGTINNYVSGTAIPVSPGATTAYNMVGNVTDAAGCSVAGTGGATITVNPSPTSAVLSGTATICTGGSTNLIVTITGGTSPYTIAINNGVGTINNYVSGTAIPVNPGATTTYNMVGNVTDALGCSVAGSGGAIVTVNTPPASAVLSGTATICSGTSTNLTVTITGGTSPYTITLDNGVGTINNYVSGTAIPVSPAATTTYNMVGNVTDAAGCSVAGTGSATVTVNPSPTSAVLSGTATICSGTSTNLTVTITGGTSPYTITINNGVGTINNYVSGTAIPVSPAATTAYSMVGNVTDALGCSVAGSGGATVTVNPSPTSAVLSGTATICAGGSTNLIVTITGGTSPYTIALDNGVGTINNYVSGTAIPVSPGATTTYNMVGNVTDALGCSVAGSGSATVTVGTPPASAVLSGTATICSGTSTNLSVTITGGTSPYTITINNGVGTINNYVSGTAIPVSPGATTAYSMVGNVTDAAGCSVAGTGGATITVNPSPTSAVLSGTATICTGGSTNLIVTITGGTSPYTIAINNGVGTINNYVSGTAIPVNPGATTTYNMVGNVTDALGCSVAGSGGAIVTVNTPPASAVLSGTATICSGTSTNLTVTITGGTSPYTITLDNGVGTINNYVSGTAIPVSPAATTTYNMVGNVTDAAGCSVAGTGSATVTVNPSPTSAVLSGTATICSGTSTNLTVTITGGTSPYTITINNGVGTINNYVSGTAIPVSPAATTAYSMVGNVTDALGCSVAGSGGATVTVNPSPTSAVLSGTATICAGGSTNLIVTITGGTSPYTIALDNGVGTINNYVSGTAIPVSPGATTTYNMVGNVTDALGCSVAGSGSATVTVGTPPASAVLSGTATICSGTSTNLSVTITGGTSPYTITINNGVGTINNYVSGTAIPVSPGATTAYSMVGNVTDAAGCSVAGTGGATITVNPSPTSAVLSGTATICTGGSTNLIVTITGGTSPYTIAINNGVGTINNYVSGTAIPVSPVAATTYNMVGNVTDALGCSVAGTGSAAVTVDVPPASNLTVGKTIDPLCTGGTSAVTVALSEVGVSYQLRNDAGDINVGAPVVGTGGTINLSTGALASTTTFNVFATRGVCPSVELTTLATVTVTGSINAGLTVTALASPICAGSTATIQVFSSEAGVNYQLRNDADDSSVGGVVAGTGGTISLPTAALAATTVFNVLASNGTCSIELVDIETVIVDIPPAVNLTVGKTIDPLCTGGTSEVTVALSEIGVSYQLRNDAGDINVGSPIAGTGGTINLSTGALATTTTFNVFATRGACPSVELTTLATITVTGSINASLSLSASANPICTGTSSNVQVLSSEAGVNYQLRNDFDDSLVGTVVAGTGGTINLPTNNLAATTIFNVFASNGTCSIELTNKQTITVSAGPDISLAVSASPGLICSGSSSSITVANSEVGISYQLRNNAGNAAVGSAVVGTGGSINLPTGNLAINTTFNVFATGSGCSAQLTNLATVTIRPIGDPACTGGTNCFAFTVTSVEQRPSCSLQDDGSITFTVTGGTPNYIVNLSDGAGFNVSLPGSGPNFTFTNLSPADYIYTIQDAAGNVCPLPYSLPVQTNVDADASGFVDATCFGQATGQATIAVLSGGSSPYDYSIDGNIWVVNKTSPILITDLPPNGTYSILVRDDASDQCPDEVIVTIGNGAAQISIGLGTTSATCGNSDGAITITTPASGATGGPYDYLLDGNPVTPVSNAFTNISGGSHILSVIDGASDCQRDFPVVVPYPGIVATSSISTSSANCTVGGTISFFINTPGSTTYEIGFTTDFFNEATNYSAAYYSPPLTPGDDGFVQISNLPRGDYYIWVKPSTGQCTTRVNSIPESVGGPYPVTFEIGCRETNGDLSLLNISGEPGVTITYEIFGASTSTGTINLDPLNNAIISGFAADPYQIRLSQDQTATSGCVITTAFFSAPTGALDILSVDTNESFPDQPTGSMRVKIIESGSEPYEIWLVEGTIGYLSDTATAVRNPVTFESNFVTLPGGDNYSVYVEDGRGCRKVTTVKLPFDGDVFVPNIFTPNNDHINDAFYIRNLPDAGSKLVITNRWGKEVFSSNNYNFSNLWNGGTEPDGVYYYRLQISGGATYSGWVEVLRGNKP